MSRRYLALPLLFLGAACARDPDFGSGPITLSPEVKEQFEEYKARDAPIYFAVSQSGLGSYYIYCHGGFSCTDSSARMMVLDNCRRNNAGEECKIYAVGRRVVWDEGDAGQAVQAQQSPSDRLTRECLDGATPETRIDRCSQAVASSALAQDQKRGPLYVRARAYEQIGDLTKAAQDYQAVLGIDPNHASAKARLAGLIAPAAPSDPMPSEDRPE